MYLETDGVRGKSLEQRSKEGYDGTQGKRLRLADAEGYFITSHSDTEGVVEQLRSSEDYVSAHWLNDVVSPCLPL